MGKTIRANAKLDDRKVASILAELQRWGNGEFVDLPPHNRTPGHA